MGEFGLNLNLPHKKKMYNNLDMIYRLLFFTLFVITLLMNSAYAPAMWHNTGSIFNTEKIIYFIVFL